MKKSLDRSFWFNDSVIEVFWHHGRKTYAAQFYLGLKDAKTITAWEISFGNSVKEALKNLRKSWIKHKYPKAAAVTKRLGID